MRERDTPALANSSPVARQTAMKRSICGARYLSALKGFVRIGKMTRRVTSSFALEEKSRPMSATACALG